MAANTVFQTMLTQRQFADDTRGVTPLIGFILLFGIGIVAFAGYQATTVPDQNTEREFLHSQDVRDDMVDLQATLQQAHSNAEAGSDAPQSATVKLGTQYRERLLAVNPPPAPGSLGTTDAYTVETPSAVGDQFNQTRFIEYQPYYNYLSPDPLRIENSLLYRDPRAGGDMPAGDNVIVHAGPNLYNNDQDKLRIPTIASSGTSVAQGTQRVAVEASPVDSDTDNRVITIPTKVSLEVWDEQLPELQRGVDFEEVQGENAPNADRDEVLDLQFNVGESDQIEKVALTRVNVNLGGDDRPEVPQSNFKVDITDIPERVTEGEEVNVDYTIENTGEIEDTQDIEFSVDDEPKDTEEGVELDTGETFSDTFNYTTDSEDIPEITVRVRSEDDTASETVSVGPEDEPFFAVDIISAPDEVAEGDDIDIDYEIENIGGDEGTQNIEFRIDDELEATEEDVTLSADETFSEIFSYTTDADDMPQVTANVASVDDTATTDILVSERGELLVENLDTPDTVERGGDITVSADIENNGQAPLTQNITFSVTDAETEEVLHTETREEFNVEGFATDSVSFDYEVDEGQDNNLEVKIATEDDAESESIAVIAPDASVFVNVDEDGVQGQQDVDTTFDVNPADADPVEYGVFIEIGPNAEERSVTIDEEEYTLTEDAAESIEDQDPTDILDANTYEDADQAELNIFRDSIDTNAEVENVDQGTQTTLEVNINPI
ncbi:hypothetical protein K0C01_02465 [Salinarchaeum sp. IM2453]|uniref:CARDB domain-containing protein n=1 Tax=Salinarchaeum sp. IM2453 TaxID=2862870 RepID=UPI001C837775|nr:CARDB domain-containing protein [Salinarchaeum sp. IM2453]QZA89046.1 hypothetical protein K0C01_02465 [Salinarchaeum sp. IM2453]